MTTPSPLQGWPVPDLEDTANIETAFLPIIMAIEKQSVMYFDDIAERNAVVTAPVKGMFAWIDSIGAFTFYTGSVWKALVGTPAGVINGTIGATADVGYILCDGGTTASAQTNYPELWSRLPATWKSGSSMVTRDLRGRTLIGAGTGSGLTARTLGDANVGAESVVLTAAELPATAVVIGAGAGHGLIVQGQSLATTVGGGAAHNNMQPSGVVNWQIKAH